MMSIQEDETYFYYTLEVIKALHLDSKVFFAGVADNAPYEFQVYSWINTLYKDGKTSDDAINEIHEKRRLFLIQNYNTS